MEPSSSPLSPSLEPSSSVSSSEGIYSSEDGDGSDSVCEIDIGEHDRDDIILWKGGRELMSLSLANEGPLYTGAAGLTTPNVSLYDSSICSLL
jgi:hypothetical protein